MITIHATKKLLAKLPVDEQGYLPLQANSPLLADSDDHSPGPLGSWHANLLTIQRRNCVILVHDQTRFPLFIPALTKPDFANLDWWFTDALMNTLLKVDANEQQMENAHRALQQLQIDTDTNRSVQGTMNRMAQDVNHYLHADGLNVAEISSYRLAEWLAVRPCTGKGRNECIWPRREFLALLDGLALPPDDAAPATTRPPADNVISLAQFRKKNR